MNLLDDVKRNLVLEHDEDDFLLHGYISSAVDYAVKYQHLDDGYYGTHPMSPSTRQAVIMLASHLYESRDGATGGFFYDNFQAAEQSMTAINNLLRLDREWKV